MHRKYDRVGRETLEFAETAPLPLLQAIVEFADGDRGPEAIDWPGDHDEDGQRLEVLDLLNACMVEQLHPLEDRCRRIRTLATGKGPASLDHVTAQRLSHEDLLVLAGQPDELCRSIWVFLHHAQAFQDAEAFHGARQYRDLGKMYDAFEIDPGATSIDKADKIDAVALASLVTARLELPSSVVIRTLDLAATQNHPASVLVIVRHAGPLSSVLSHKDNGLRATIYYRPPNEATLIWTPADQTLEICGPSPGVRRTVAETFAETVFRTDLSTKPLNWRHYDLSRFHKSLDLDPPAWDDVDIEITKLVAVDMRLGVWSRRLSLKVTIDDDIGQVARKYLGGDQILRKAEGFSGLTVAVKYRRHGEKRTRSMEITFGDRRSNLQGKTDAAQRELGYRLLQHWGVLNRLRPLDFDEIHEILPELLALHDLPESEVASGHLRRLGLDPKRLLDAGVIAHRGRAKVVLIDEDEEVTLEAGARGSEMAATDSFGGDAGIVSREDILAYVLKRDWLEEIVLGALRPLINKGRIEHLGENLACLGMLDGEDGQVPIYLVRRLDTMETLQASDMVLRQRQEGGIGIVLAATSTPLTHLGPNVVVPLPDVLSKDGLDDAAISSIWHRFRMGRLLARGGTEVALMRFGPQMAMLLVPRQAPLTLSGAKQVRIMERLVVAYKAGQPGVQTGELIEGTGVKSPGDAWPSEVRKTVAGVYFEKAGRGLWRLKVD